MSKVAIPFNGTITFRISAAKKLPDTDHVLFNVADHVGQKDLTDPLVSIDIDNDEKFRTKHIDNCLDPVWTSHNTFEFTIKGIIQEIVIRVKDKEWIGSVNVGAKRFDNDSLKALQTDKKAEGWFDLRTNDGEGEYLPEAKLQMSIEYKNIISGDYIT
jgi:hypothetical protein